MDSYSTLVLNQKLKSSCDICSVSKVRCDSGKPACSRCSGLKQPCTYSPARRAGRPHRLRRESEQQHQHQQHRQEPPKRPDKRCSATPPERSSYAFEAVGDFNWWSDANMVDTPASSATQRPENDYFDFMGSCLPEPSSNRTQDASTSTGGDCVKTAASILEQLDSARKGPHRSASGLGTTMVCKMLLTILVCPCSEQPTVALLVASGCLALMDTVCCHPGETVSFTNPAAGLAPPCWTNSTADGLGRNSYLEPDLFGWSRVSPPAPAESSSSLAGTEQGGIEGLAKIAKLILRYSERYHHELHKSIEGESGAYTARLVEPIVMLLRLKLQSVTQRAAGRLVL